MMNLLPDEDDSPFSVPRDVPELMPDDYPALDSNVDSHEAYDEGLDDSAADYDPYRPDDDPIGSIKDLMWQRNGGKEMYTTDHYVIRKWAEERGGSPARISAANNDGLYKGGLFIFFADELPAAEIEQIEWESFFESFEENKLAFLFKNTTPSGSDSRFYEFIDRIAASRITKARRV